MKQPLLVFFLRMISVYAWSAAAFIALCLSAPSVLPLWVMLSQGWDWFNACLPLFLALISPFEHCLPRCQLCTFHV